MDEPTGRAGALGPLAEELTILMSGLSPGSPQYYALNAAYEACRRAERVVCGHGLSGHAGRSAPGRGAGR